jgi:hypothetical protein
LAPFAILAALIAALTSVPAAAQAPTALTPAEAAQLDRAMHGTAGVRGACTGSPEEIVVCGRRLAGGGQRMEFEREPGEIVRHINEPGTGMAALAAGGCSRLCNVGVQVNVIEAAKAVPKIFRHILGRD